MSRADMNQKSVLEVKNLSVRVSDGARSRNVIADVNLDVRAGETVCIVGESGSGKSVTSLAIMGLLPKNILSPSGTILLDGENVLGAGNSRLRQLRATRMALVFQEPMTALNPVEPVGKQIEEVLKLHRRYSQVERRKKVIDMMKSVHLPTPDEIYDAYPHQLSGGQRQRIVICMALILKPALLIADEPTTALDVTTQRQILALIKELQQTLNTAVIFITHDFGVVAEIADRIVVMHKGAVVETGTREEILSSPKQAYTRMLVSSVPSLTPKDKGRLLGEPILSVTALSKVYREFRLFKAGRSVNAVKDAEFSLRKGEIVGIVGESGSGKSTLARCISRLIVPTSGTINLGGHDIANMSSRQLRPFRRRIQIVFQDPYRSLNARLRVGDSIVEGLLNFGIKRPAARQKAAELIRLVGMEPDVLRRYPHQFSGGQRQRICIARALALEPDILVADEAVSALDVSVQSQVLALVESIRDRKNIGIVFITHDLRVAAQICDTIIVMKDGEIVEAAPARQVLLHPSHEYTRTLLSAAPGRAWDFQNFRPI
jgi:peptide/nickel transport system ATP-binding protein